MAVSAEPVAWDRDLMMLAERRRWWKMSETGMQWSVCTTKIKLKQLLNVLEMF